MYTIVKALNSEQCNTLHINIHLGATNAYTKDYYKRASANGEFPNGVAQYKTVLKNLIILLI